MEKKNQNQTAVVLFFSLGLFIFSVANAKIVGQSDAPTRAIASVH